MRFRFAPLVLLVAAFLVFLALTQGCSIAVPTNGDNTSNGDTNNDGTNNGDTNNGGTDNLEGLLSLLTSGQAQGGGDQGTSTADAVQQLFGSLNNPDASSVAFRALRSNVTAEASARRMGQIVIARTSMPFDQPDGNDPDEEVIPGAEITVVGVGNVSDEEGNDDDVFPVDGDVFGDVDIDDVTGRCIDVPSRDALDAGLFRVIADSNGDVYLPPLPPLDGFEEAGEDLCYILEVDAPDVIDLEETRVAFRPRSGQIVLVGDDADPEIPTETYNITDYFPAIVGRRYVYQEHVSRTPWSLWVHDPLRTPLTADQDTAWQGILEGFQPFTSFPFEAWEGVEYFADNATKWQWFAPGDDGLSLFADAPMNAPGQVVPIVFWSPPLVFQNGLELGTLGTQELDAIWSAQATVEELGDGSDVGTDGSLRATYQIHSVGDVIDVLGGTFEDTMTVVWTIPFPESDPVDNTISFSADYNQVTVWTLARDLGIVTAEVWRADPSNPRMRDLMYYAELAEFEDGYFPGDNPPQEQGLTVNFEAPEGTAEVLCELSLLFNEGDEVGQVHDSRTVPVGESAVFQDVPEGPVRVKAWGMADSGATIARGEADLVLGPGANVLDLVLEGLSPAQPATITLTWGEFPSDLDAHVLGPDALNNDVFHVAWFKMGNLDAAPWLNLDRDDVTSFGPEINTFSDVVDGIYQYGVHNYSDWAGDAMLLWDSEAHVSLALPDGGLWEWDAPLPDAGDGDLWHVFDIEVNGGAITNVFDVNEVVDLYDWWSPGLARSAMPRK